MVSDVYHFYDIVHFHLTPPFHPLLLFLSRSPAQTWVETERPSPAPEGARKVPGSRRLQDSCQGQRHPAGHPSRPTPGPTLFLEFSQMFVPWPACSQPCPGQPCTNLRKRKVNRPEAVWVQLPKAAPSSVWPTNCTPPPTQSSGPQVCT